MTRNDPAPDGTSHRRQRQPITWPMALVLLGLFGVVAFGLWLCAGVATDIWGGQ